MKIPNGHQAVMPYMIVDGVDKFIDFVTRVFQANITFKGKNQDGSTGHCEMNIGGCTIMFSNSNEKWSPRTNDLFVYVPNADETFAKALSEGGTAVMELADQDYGRSGGVKDGWGNVWWITSVR